MTGVFGGAEKIPYGADFLKVQKGFSGEQKFFLDDGQILGGRGR